MREIKFRGKRVDNGEWVYGDLTRYSEEMSYITVDLIENEVYQVSTETVGQYTGLKDKNGIEIYERDKIFDEHREYWGYVEFDEGCFHAVLENVCYKLFEVQNEIQVIGNIHEDEEL